MQPGPLGAVVPDVLEVLGDDEQQPVDGEQHGEQRERWRRCRRGRGTPGRPSSGRRRAARPATNRTAITTRRHEQADDQRRQPAVVRALDERVGERADADDEQELPAQVEARAWRGRTTPRRRPAPARRPTAPMTTLTKKMLRQPTRSVSTPPSVGPMARPTDGDARPDADGPGLGLRVGEGRADEGQRGDVDGGGADALQAAADVQDAQARRRPHSAEAAENRIVPTMNARRRPCGRPGSPPT